MAKTVQPDRIRLDRAKILPQLAKAKKTRLDLARHLGLKSEQNLNTKLTRDRNPGAPPQWTPHQAEAASVLLSCTIEAITLDLALIHSDTSGFILSAKPTILTADAITDIYENLQPSDYVLIFSMDGFIEAKPQPWNRDFYQMVLKAVKSGINSH
jgi:hypothetical protein